MNDNTTTKTPGGAGFFLTLAAVIGVSTVVGIVFWKYVKKDPPSVVAKNGKDTHNNSTQGSDENGDGPGFVIGSDGKMTPIDGSRFSGWETGFRKEGEGYGKVPPFKFTNHLGVEFTENDLAGKVWIADFVFTRCAGPCPAMSAEMSRLRSDLKELKNVEFVSFSVDPNYDTPEVLKNYASYYGGAGEGWHLITGAQKELFKLAVATFKVTAALEDPNDPTNIAHSTRFFLIDRDLVIRGRYASEEREQMSGLRADAKILAQRQ
ncbi:MAG: SCO family protein [Planctomycetota bacterium]